MKQKDLVVDTMSMSMPSATSITVVHSGKDTTMENAPAPGSDGPSFSFDFGANKSQGDILTSLIGSELEVVQAENPPITGLLMSVEKAHRAINDDNVISEWDAICLMERATFSVSKIQLSDLRGFKILDQTLQADLMLALSKSLKQKKSAPPKTGKTRIRINAKRARGQDAPDKLSLSYVETLKAWRASYRMNLSSSAGGPDKDAYVLNPNPTHNQPDQRQLTFYFARAFLRARFARAVYPCPTRAWTA
jgi:hypothetical protein